MNPRFAINHAVSGNQGNSAEHVISDALTSYRGQIADKNLTVELNVDLLQAPITPMGALGSLLDRVLSLAVSRCEYGGELLITALESDRGRTTKTTQITKGGRRCRRSAGSFVV